MLYLKNYIKTKSIGQMLAFVRDVRDNFENKHKRPVTFVCFTLVSESEQRSEDDVVENPTLLCLCGQRTSTNRYVLKIIFDYYRGPKYSAHSCVAIYVMCKSLKAHIFYVPHSLCAI